MTEETPAESYFGFAPSVADVENLMKHHTDTRLRSLEKPCHDCAVICEFYEPFADALRILPEHRQKFHAERWTCHNNPTRACRGIFEYLNLENT